MSTNTEIKNVINAYNIMKADLHTLLVKGSKSPLDYDGIANIEPEVVSFEYPINEANQSKKTYDMLFDIGDALANMLKADLRLWNKTSGIRALVVAPDRRCETVILEVWYM